jgi:tRNA(Ile)-lysidine synthetase-like protein
MIFAFYLQIWKMNKQSLLYQKKILKKVALSVKEYAMITEGDKLIVGLSGGKDSLVLLDLLFLLRQNLPFHFEMMAVHVRSESIPYETSIEYLKKFCIQRDIKLVVTNTVIDFSTDKRKTPCFLCSTTRRKSLFDAARLENASKVALGHHMNDAVETLLMNMMFNGSISSIPPKLSIFRGEIDIIRPLIGLTEKEIKEYADKKEIQTQAKECPFAEKTQRKAVKEIISQMARIYPYSLQSINTSMSRIFEEYLVQSTEKKPINEQNID